MNNLKCFIEDIEMNDENKNGDKEENKVMEERALSVFSSERSEDMTALVLCLITTFLVLLFTKWLV